MFSAILNKDGIYIVSKIFGWKRHFGPKSVAVRNFDAVFPMNDSRCFFWSLGKFILKISVPLCFLLIQTYMILKEKKISSHRNVICVDCKQYVDILEGNILAPYKFKGVS
uniref:Uncharacterized protein n=1 Tax=Timema genevievae TaxID=629358 RepID=A0A7R9PSA6_TIMGE|nr:unnamed protein product [Timema genevievae]